MTTNPVNYNFNVTNNYLNELTSRNCTVTSVAAKVSFLAFPIIITMTVLIDLFSKSTSANLAEKLDTILSNKDAAPKKCEQFYEVLMDLTPREFTHVAIQAATNPVTFLSLVPKIQRFMEEVNENEGDCAEAVERKAFAEFPIFVQLKTQLPQLMQAMQQAQQAQQMHSSFGFQQNGRFA